ncbi:MAG: CHAD domain-containing protein, partial [Anaerolineaceae bacterium]|nr:CHAD domain-containing protein [Anaerolineaceae bacterium]
AYQDCLWNPHDIERHHQMRIEAKRFRYAMETLSDAYPEKLKQFISAAKALQTLLGELHDCDIWIDQSEAFLKSERQRTIDYYGTDRPFARLKVGIEYLLEQRRLQRQELFGRLGDLWNELSRNKIWEKLVQKLDSCTVPPAADFAGPVRRSPMR